MYYFALIISILCLVENGSHAIFMSSLHKTSLYLANQQHSLQSIIANKAILSSIFNAVNEEIFTNNSLISDITNNHFHLQSDLSSFGLGMWFLYYRYSYIVPKIDKKLGDIEHFYKIRRRIDVFIILFLFIFVKNVGCAF